MSRVVDRSVSAARLCPGLYREGVPNDPEDAPMTHTDLVSVVAALLMSEWRRGIRLQDRRQGREAPKTVERTAP